MPNVVEAVFTGGRLIRGTSGRVEVTVYVNGTATAAGSTPTFTITRADGTELAAAQSASTAVTGVYYYALTPAQLSRVDTLTVTLAGTWDSVAAHSFAFDVEVVGEPLFTLAEARSFDASAMTSATTYPTATLLEARDQITDLLEEWTGVSWIPRHDRYSLPGSGSRELLVRKRQVTSLIAATIDGTAVTVSNVTVTQIPGVLIHETALWSIPSASNPQNVTVEYAHGFSGHPNGVKRIALLLLRDRLVKSDIPAGALSASMETGSFQLVQPGGPYGNVSRLPEVNQWVRDHQYRTPLIGSL